jgi:hypothetical protein
VGSEPDRVDRQTAGAHTDIVRAAHRHRWGRAAFAIAAAYALALQALLAGAVAAAHLSRAAHAASLCQPEDRDPGQGRPAAPHGGECCAIACHGSPLNRAPDATVAGAARAWTALTPDRARFVGVVALPLRPLGARAPPPLG